MTDETSTEKTPTEHLNDLKTAGTALWNVLADKVQALAPTIVTNEAMDRLEAADAEIARLTAENEALYVKQDAARKALSEQADAIRGNAVASELWTAVDGALNS